MRQGKNTNRRSKNEKRENSVRNRREKKDTNIGSERKKGAEARIAMSEKQDTSRQSNRDKKATGRKIKKDEKELNEIREALRKSEIERETILDSLVEHVIHEDIEMKILWANRAACESAGLKREELVGRYCYEIWPRRSTPCPDCPVMKAMETKEPQEIEKSTPDGRFWFIRGYPVLDENGEVAGGVELTLDITRRKLAEQQIRGTKERLQYILSATSGVIYTAKTSGDHETTFISDNITQMVGYRPEKFLEDSGFWIENVHPDDVQKVSSETPLAFQEDSRKYEYRFKCKDSAYIWIRDEMKLMRDQDGKPLEMIGFWVDITERKKAEEEKEKLQKQLVQSQKMEAGGRLAGGVAHDFNNILTVINGHSNLLLNDLELSDPIREDLEEICEAGQRASDLTKQLLAFSRRQFLEPKVLNLNTVIHNLQKMLHRIIGEDIRLVTSFDKHLRNVKADPVQLEQIIINLAVNAREAMSGGGSLTIKTENLEIDQDCAGLDMPSEPGQYVKVTISDTGTGMVEEIRLVLTDVVMPDKDGKELADEIISRKLDVKIMYMSGYTDDAIVQHGIIKTDIPFLQKPFTPKQLTSKIP